MSGIADQLNQPGSVTAFVLAVTNIFAFIRGWVIPRFIYDSEVTDLHKQIEILRLDRDFHKDMAWKFAENNRRALEIIEVTSRGRRDE